MAHWPSLHKLWVSVYGTAGIMLWIPEVEICTEVAYAQKYEEN